MTDRPIPHVDLPKVGSKWKAVVGSHWLSNGSASAEVIDVTFSKVLGIHVIVYDYIGTWVTPDGMPLKWSESSDVAVQDVTQFLELWEPKHD